MMPASSRPSKRAFEFIRSMYANTGRARRAFSRLKSDYAYEDIQSAISLVVRSHRAFARNVISEPFPTLYREYRKGPAGLPYGNVDAELRWTVAVLSLFAVELQQFVQLKRDFEYSFCLVTIQLHNRA